MVMAYVSPRMGLRIWNNDADIYDHQQLADNFFKLDIHDHSFGKGTQIGTGGIVDGSVTAAKLSSTFYFSPGDIKTSAAAIVPVGWIICDGASYLRADATYAALYAAIGVTFGSADGTHFNVPDLRGRVMVGSGTGAGLTARALGASFGEEAHQLTVPELAAHNHIGDNAEGSFVGGGSGTAANITTAGSGAFAVKGMANTGGDQAHNNMQPSQTINVLIKL